MKGGLLRSGEPGRSLAPSISALKGATAERTPPRTSEKIWQFNLSYEHKISKEQTKHQPRHFKISKDGRFARGRSGMSQEGPVGSGGISGFLGFLFFRILVGFRLPALELVKDGHRDH